MSYAEGRCCGLQEQTVQQVKCVLEQQECTAGIKCEARDKYVVLWRTQQEELVFGSHLFTT